MSNYNNDPNGVYRQEPAAGPNPNYGHPEGGPIPPQYFQPKPKKKHTGLKVLGVVVAFVVVLLGISAAVGGSPANDAGSAGVTSESATPAKGSAAQTKTPAPTAPRSKPVEESAPAKLVKGYKAGPFTLAASVRVTRGGLGSFDAKINAVNSSDEEQMAVFKVTVIKGDDILGTLDCIGGGGNPIPAGATMTAACISTDDYQKGWTQVQLEHTGF